MSYIDSIMNEHSDEHHQEAGHDSGHVDTSTDSARGNEGNEHLMNQLRQDVEEFVDLTLQIEETNKSLKIVRSRKKELNESISEFMKENGIGVINSKSGGKIKLAQRKKLGKVDRSYLEEQLSNKVGRDKAVELMTYAFENRTSEETSSVRVEKSKS